MSFVRILFFLPIAALAAVVPDRYIVELSTEPVASHVQRSASLRSLSHKSALESDSAQTHRSRIRGEQRSLRERIANEEGGSVLGDVNTVANALFVRLSDAQAARLAKMSGVLRVHKVHTVHKLLDRAIVIHKLTQAWSQVGFDSAGSGVKIGIIDTGIDAGHPGFQDPSLPALDGYPKVNDASDVRFTNNKVIAARSYPDLLKNRDPDRSARDHDGHGTAVAMCAAGVRIAGPLATISGFAPKAYLGSYKVFGSPGINDGATDDAILQAFEDAANDGMDIINLSLGGSSLVSLDQDPLVNAVERVSALGIIVVVSAGNDGPDLDSISSPSSAPSAISVGASENDRKFLSQVSVTGAGSFPAYSGDKNKPPSPLQAPLADVAALDGDGRACSSLPANSLTGKVALILRGPCTFEQKLNNAQRAGAIAGLVYTSVEREAGVPDSGLATIPIQMISNPDGLIIKNRLASSQGSLTATLDFGLVPAAVNPDSLVDFSARGPNVDLSIKPDLVAVGKNVYTAAESSDPAGDVYSASGFALINGTSFSAPITAGAAAVVKSFRPGLTAAQYRSLLIDNASPISSADGVPARVQQAGGGLLDVSAALNATVTAAPVSMTFGAGSGDVSTVRTLTLTNIGTAPDIFQLSVTPRGGGIGPQLSAGSLQLQPGDSESVQMTFTGSLLRPGQYEGAIHVLGARSTVDTHVPYWYGVIGPAIKLIDFPDLGLTRGRVGLLVRDAFVFRAMDASGIPIPDPDVQVTVTSGDGSVASVGKLPDLPGLFGVTVRLGPLRGVNTFHVQVGDLGRDFTVTGR